MDVLGVEPSGGALQSIALYTAHINYFFCVRDPRPGTNVFCNVIAYQVELRRRWSPDATAKEQAIAGYMHIESWRMRTFARFVPEMHARVGLVGCFVFRKARIAINPEHGTAVWPGVCHVMP